MKFNGMEITMEESVILQAFLEKKGYETVRIAVELNGEIVPKCSYPEVLLKQGDVLEVVSFVGGG